MKTALIIVSVVAFLLLAYLLIDKLVLSKKKLKVLDNHKMKNQDKTITESEEYKKLKQEMDDFNLTLKNEIHKLDNNIEISVYDMKGKLNFILEKYHLLINNKQGKITDLEKNLLNKQNLTPEIKEVIKTKEKEVLKLKLSEEEFEQVLVENRNYLLMPKDSIKNLFPQQRSEPKETKSFLVEGLMAAGPRKADENETNADLGEDTCGFVEIDDWLYTWVLDGESDSTAIKSLDDKILFNSRTLAQDMGSVLADIVIDHHYLLENIKEEHLENIFHLAIDKVNIKWNEILQKAELKDYYGNNPYYGSTLIMTCLNKNTKELLGFRLGDSLLITFNDDGNLIEQGEIFYGKQKKSAMYLMFEDNKFTKADLNKEDYQTGRIDGVFSLMLFSDGLITKRKDVQDMGNLEQQKNWLEDFKHKTFARDDKSLLTARIIKN